jgi:hypothetical protein
LQQDEKNLLFRQLSACVEQHNEIKPSTSSSPLQTPPPTHCTQGSSSSSSSGSSSSSRRGLLLRSTLLPPLLLVGSDDATTIVNSILSGYGLPTLAPTKGFRAYDEFEDDYIFSCEQGPLDVSIDGASAKH